jgi:hypothetical protein
MLFGGRITLTPPVAAVIAFVRQRVVALFDTPDAWGPPEAVELQLLLLLEMWHVASGASQEETDGVVKRYQRYLRRTVPGPPISLASRLELTTRANERFVEVLRAFAMTELAPRRDQGVLSVARAPLVPCQDRSGLLHLEA